MAPQPTQKPMCLKRKIVSSVTNFALVTSSYSLRASPTLSRMVYSQNFCVSSTSCFRDCFSPDLNDFTARGGRSRGLSPPSWRIPSKAPGACVVVQRSGVVWGRWAAGQPALMRVTLWHETARQIELSASEDETLHKFHKDPRLAAHAEFFHHSWPLSRVRFGVSCVGPSQILRRFSTISLSRVLFFLNSQLFTTLASGTFR